MASLEFRNQQRAWHLRETSGNYRETVCKYPLGQTTGSPEWSTNRRRIHTNSFLKTSSPYQEHYAATSVIKYPNSLQVRGKYASFPKWTISPMMGTLNIPTQTTYRRRSTGGLSRFVPQSAVAKLGFWDSRNQPKVASRRIGLISERDNN